MQVEGKKEEKNISLKRNDLVGKAAKDYGARVCKCEEVESLMHQPIYVYRQVFD